MTGWESIPELRQLESRILTERGGVFTLIFSPTSMLIRAPTLPLPRVESFFSLNRSNNVSKNPSFYADFKNVHFIILVKSAPKKSLIFIALPKFYAKHLGVKITGLYLSFVLF
jgi:hypothetical protein